MTHPAVIIERKTMSGKELQLLTSDRAKDMFKTWKKVRTAEMKSQGVTI